MTGDPHSSLQREVETVVSDYFPRPFTRLDRDLTLSLVQATVDYAYELGFRALDARDLLALDEVGTVTVRAPELRMTMRSAYRLPAMVAMTLLRMRHDPLRWVDDDLQRLLRAVPALRDGLGGLSEAELMQRIVQGVAIRDAVFTSRRRHFLSTFTLKFAAGVTRKLDRPWVGGARGLPPTRRFRKDLVRLAQIWQQAASDSAKQADLDAALAGFLAEHGGKGQTFVPLPSDTVWDVDADALLAALPAIAASTTAVDADHEEPACRPRGLSAIDRRLSRIATERDWVSYGYEQATRIIRDAVLELGSRLEARGALASSRDIFAVSLDALGAVVSGRATTLPPRRDPVTRSTGYSREFTAAVRNGTAIAGFGASPGVVEGRCRIIGSVDQFGDLRPGEILVCEMTSPAWMPLLAIAAGVVTDRGGMLSHAAIVAREFGKPAVTGTKDATVRMVTGNSYRIDGTAGKVVSA